MGCRGRTRQLVDRHHRAVAQGAERADPAGPPEDDQPSDRGSSPDARRRGPDVRLTGVSCLVFGVPHRLTWTRRPVPPGTGYETQDAGTRDSSEITMNPTFGGASIFGTACHVVHMPHPVAHQKDEYFGVTGMTALYGGGRGRRFEVAGVLVGGDPLGVI